MKIQDASTSDKRNDKLHEDHWKCLIIPLSVLRMRNISYKRRRENQNSYFVFNNIFILKSYLIRDNVTIWRMHLACWITKATDIHTVCNDYCFSTTSNGCTNAPQVYVLRTLSVFLGLECFIVMNYELYTVLTVWVLALCVITPCCLVGSRQSF